MYTKLYRIHTEFQVEYEINVRKILNPLFDSYSIFYPEGVWKGIPEYSLTIEIYTDGNLDQHELVYAVAKDIKQANKQDAVLVASFNVAAHLI